jgi:membrane-associated phospholipid phosphatase
VSEAVEAHDAPRREFTAALFGRLALGALALAALLVVLGFVIRYASDSLIHADGVMSRWFVNQRDDAWDSITLVASDMAKTATVIAVAIVAFFALRLWLKRWYESIVLAIALAGEVFIFLTVATVVQRARPPVFRLDPAPPTSSFPSGHTAAAVVVYGFLAFVIWRYAANRYLAAIACVLLVAVPLAVGLSRLYRGAHFPLDVLGGAVLGIVWLTFVVRTLLPSTPAKEDAPA